MKGKTARAMTAVLGTTMTLLSMAPAAGAQWSTTAIGVAEYDTKETLLLLAGLSAGPGGLGWSPRIGVQGYYLTFDAGAADIDVTVVKPYVGLTNNFGEGSIGGTVGYAFSNRDNDTFVSPALTSDRGEGVVVSGEWQYWGSGGPLGYQALASYNFGSEAFWTRGRVTTRLGQANGRAQRRLGAEVAYLGDEDFSAVQPGAIVEFHSAGGQILGLGAGMKFFEGGDDAVYFKVEGVLPFGR